MEALVPNRNKALGAEILKQAEESQNKELSAKVVSQIRNIKTEIYNRKSYIAQTQKEIDKLEKQLQAIADGNFELSPEGRVIFDDPIEVCDINSPRKF